MRATLIDVAGDVRVEDVPDPVLREPTDALVRVVRSCICGSDLWPYGSRPATAHGDRIGHEFLGMVEDIGADVSGLNRGDLVVARKNHDELFPGHVSTLATTDPEMVEYFDNFAFDEVLRYGTLDTGTRLMVQLAALIAGQALSEYRVMLGAALTVGVTPVQAKEIVYQAVPYVGMGKVFDFLHATNDVLTARGVTLPLPGQSTTTPDTREEKGLAVQKQIVGADTVDAMYAKAPADEMHLQRYLSANCFGDHYTRTGLDLPTRELLTFAMLIAMGGCEPQAKGHVAANLNVGNDRRTLLSIATQLLPFIGYPRTLNAVRVIDDVIPA
jgi:4-carboxymuconolactone decarboxylase